MPSNKKTGVGMTQSADQIQDAYVGFVFQTSFLVEKLTGHNPTVYESKGISIVMAIEELEENAKKILLNENSGKT